MSDRPLLAFSYKLAGHLGMTVGELGTRMTVPEWKWWLAFHRFVCPIGDEWWQTGKLIAAVLAPYTKGRPPKPSDFVPIEKPPMSAEEIAAELSKLFR